MEGRRHRRARPADAGRAHLRQSEGQDGRRPRRAEARAAGLLPGADRQSRRSRSAMLRLPREAGGSRGRERDLFDGIVTVVADAEAADATEWDGDLYRSAPPAARAGASSPRCPTTSGTTAARTGCWSGFRSNSPSSSPHCASLHAGYAQFASRRSGAKSGTRLGVRQRMVLVDQLLQPLVEHMRIDLRRRDVGMAEQRLHDAEIGAAGEEMRRESVPQHMRRDLSAYRARRAPRLLFRSRAKACRVRWPARAVGGKQPLAGRPVRARRAPAR